MEIQDRRRNHKHTLDEWLVAIVCAAIVVGLVAEAAWQWSNR